MTNYEREQKAREDARLREEARQLRSQQSRNQRAEQVLGGEQSGTILSGTAKEQEGQLAGLNTANIIYGQGLGQTGQDVQDLLKQYKERAAQGGGDPVTAAIMGQKAGAVAGAQRQMAQQGVKGGAAIGAVDELSRKRDQEIASSLYGQQRQSLGDVKGMVSNIISGSTALMQGEKAANVQQPSAPKDTGITVICGELHRQGYMPSGLYAKDAAYGDFLTKNNIHVIIGYQFWAIPVVKLMRKSKLFTKLMAIPALKWAKHIAGEEESLFGKFCVNVGEPVCAMIGKALCKLRRVYV